MGSIADLSYDAKYFEETWEEIRGDFGIDLRREGRRALKRLLETSMSIEVQDLIGSERWEHNPNRCNYRNGYYYRDLITGLGHISDIKVPRVRKGSVEFKCIKRYKGRTKEIDDMICEIFLNGVSTRDVSKVIEPLLGLGSVSATTISNITKELDDCVIKFHNRSLNDIYKYLILDGIYLNIKSPIYKRKRCVLVCYGIKEDGKKELIDFQIAGNGESEDGWLSFLNLLYNRGLAGKHLALVVIDGNKGLYNAVRFIYPQAKVQRCWAHKLRNVANYCPRKIEKEVIKGARDIYLAVSKTDALKAYKEWRKKWFDKVPKAIKCLEDDLEELLNFYDMPSEFHKKIRTTNMIERVFREVRRRTRPMSCFQNKKSLERIIFAIFSKLNKSWR